MRMVDRGEAVHGFEAGYVSRDGREGIVRLSIGGRFELAGEECVLAVIRDVTETKRVECAIRESEGRYRSLFEAANDAVILLQHEVIVDCNDRTHTLFDLPREALIGTSPWLHSPPTQPDGQESRAMGRQIMSRVMSGENMVFEWMHLRRDGSPAPAEIGLSALTIEGEPALLAVLRDISDRKKAETELRGAYDEIRQLRDQLEAENIYLREEIEHRSDLGDIIGESEPMRMLAESIQLVAPTDSTVLLLGESGTGKELVAREIHRHSGRRLQAMIRVNCASIPGELYESEFFGHVKGAFTGAVRDRAGRFELANGGTIFLDEIAEIPLPMQAKLLRVIQEGEYERVGDERTRKTDVRILAATNRDLEHDVRERRFRADLFYRLNVFPLQVPPLRERGEDILVLTRHFLAVHCTALNLPMPPLTRVAMLQLQSYDWPGNVRELQNLIERAVIIGRGGRLTFDLPLPGASGTPDARGGRPSHGFLTENQMKAFELRNIAAVLERANGQVFGPDGAAALLGVRPTTLTSRMKKLGLQKPNGRAEKESAD